MTVNIPRIVFTDVEVKTLGVVVGCFALVLFRCLNGCIFLKPFKVFLNV
jgi:hypothetical protein